MIGYTKVLRASVQGNMITDDRRILNKYTNVNALIPAGSMFYNESIINYENLPDASLTEIPEGQVAFNLAVTTESTYGNSIYPNNYVDIYMKALDTNGKVIVGKVVENVKVLAVKDRNGNNVFENSEEDLIPSMIIFGVTEEIHLLLRKATYLSAEPTAVELIPVPTNEALKNEPGEIAITSSMAADYINSYSQYLTQGVTTPEVVE